MPVQNISNKSANAYGLDSSWNTTALDGGHWLKWRESEWRSEGKNHLDEKDAEMVLCCGDNWVTFITFILVHWCYYVLFYSVLQIAKNQRLGNKKSITSGVSLIQWSHHTETIMQVRMLVHVDYNYKTGYTGNFWNVKLSWFFLPSCLALIQHGWMSDQWWDQR